MHFSKERNTRLLFGAVLAILMLGLVLSACGGGGGSSTGGGTEASEETSETENASSETAANEPASNETASGGEYSIGIVQFSSSDEGSSLVLAGYEKEAKQLGYEVTSIDPNGETDKAVAAIQTLVTKGVDMIVTAVFPSNELAAGLIAAKNAGIPVVSVDGGLAEGVEVNWTGEQLAGSELSKKMMEETGGKGYLLTLGYKLGTPCVEREEALDETIKGSELETNETREEVPIPGQVAAGTQFAQAFLAKHPNSDEQLSIWACWDEPALGAITAVKQAKRSGVGIYGINGQPAAVKAVQDGNMTATWWIDLEGAGEEIAAHSAEAIEAGVEAEPKNVPVGGVLVDAENVEQFIKEHPGAAG